MSFQIVKNKSPLILFAIFHAARISWRKLSLFEKRKGKRFFFLFFCWWILYLNSHYRPTLSLNYSLFVKFIQVGSSGTSSRMSTPVEFPIPANHYMTGSSASSTTATTSSMYSTFPRLHHSSSSSATTPSPSGRTPFINQLLGSQQAPQPASSSCPSCPSPSCSSSSNPPMMMTEVLDEPVEEEVGQSIQNRRRERYTSI